MKTIEYKFDKFKSLLPGEWRHEPDKKQWLDETSGFPCLIVRNGLGALCGYVGINKNHPSFEKVKESKAWEVDDVLDLRVHGGITFADKCQPSENNEGICHLTENEEDEDIIWLGFDCSHCDDLKPKYKDYWVKFREIFDENTYSETYRNFEYVENEVRNLARQLKEIK